MREDRASGLVGFLVRGRAAEPELPQEVEVFPHGTARMRVTSKAGTALDVDMVGASTVGVWGWTDKPGTLAHWPGGIVVSFPKSGTINGTLVMAPGDINLTFKRYLSSPVKMTLKDDYVVELEGEGTDAAMMRAYLAAWGDREAYARLLHELIPLCRQLDFLDRAAGAACQDLHLVSGRVSAHDEFNQLYGRRRFDLFPARESGVPRRHRQRAGGERLGRLEKRLRAIAGRLRASADTRHRQSAAPGPVGR